MRRGLVWHVLVAVEIGSAPGLAVAQLDLNAHATLATDYVFRGVSQTLSAEALQLDIGLEHESGWFTYIWASNVDFAPAYTVDDGARLELNLAGGYSFEISDRLAATLGATRYLFPNTKAGIDYDYLEWLGSLELDAKYELTMGYSNDVFGSGFDGSFVALAMDHNLGQGLAPDLVQNLALRFELGHYDIDAAYSQSYSYAELALIGGSRAVEWRLSYFSTSGEAQALFYESTVGERLVFALTLSF
ncbi:MAG: TorF family putative porin [Congregibacter sp.]